MTPEKPSGQRSLRQAAREGVRSDPPQQLPKPVAMSHQTKVKPPVVGTEPVYRSCGHVEDFELFADKADRYRQERRKKFNSKPCTACRDAKQAVEQAKQQKVKADRKPKPRIEDSKGRLPNGATYTACYSAENKEWSGTLCLPGSLESSGVRFSASKSGLFPLLSYLDTMYRQWLLENTEKKE